MLLHNLVQRYLFIKNFWLPLFFCLATTLSFSSRAVADSITYCGIQFKIDSREVLVGSTVKVVINRKPILLAERALERGVVLAYLSDPELVVLVPIRDLQQLVSRALAEGDTEVAVQGFVAALSSRSLSTDAYGDFLAGIMALEGGNSVVSRALQVVGSDIREQPLCVTLSQIGVDSLSRVGEILRRRSFVDSCSTLLIDRSAVLLQQGYPAQAARYLRAVMTLVAGDRSRQTEVVQSYNQMTVLVEALKKRSSLDTVASLERLRRDKLFSHVSVAAISSVIVRGSEQWLEQGDAAGALYLLSQTDSISRTPLHHNLVLKSIELLPTENASVLDEDQVKSGLRLYASKDDGIRAALVRYLSLAAEQRAGSKSKGDAQEAVVLMSLLGVFRPDPSELNDAIRARCAAALIASDMMVAANLIMKQMVTGVSISLRLRTFAYSGFIGGILTSLGCIVAVVVVFYLVVAGLRLVGIKLFVKGVEVSESEPKHTAVEEQAFVAYPADLRTSSARGEYELLLHEFGLPPHASVHEIKLAYREKVKTVHPDRNPLTGGAKSDDFIELTAKYDRLLELLEEQDRAE
jgi:hypothetical protein